MSTIRSNNFILTFIRKHQLGILLSMMLVSMIYDTIDFEKRAGNHIAEYIVSNNFQNFDEFKKAIAEDNSLRDILTEDLKRSRLIRSICPLCSSTGDATR